ncbi:hypothetical protein [Halobaculum sp. EA56]|uniref:hypothetical protein n=1 Tax=Halobaculum sp. EA56 TaxID=3421648 RepID=UPI003EBDC6AF
MEENENGEVSRFGRSPFTKGLQPRVVLGLLFGGSLAGIWVTHIADTLENRIVTWLLVVSVGVLVGGLYWRVALFDRSTFNNLEYCRYVQNRWERIEAVAVWGAILSGTAYVTFSMSNDPFGIVDLALAIALICALAIWGGIRWYTDGSTRRRTVLRASLLLVAFGSLGSFAWLETGTSPFNWIVRLGHVGAFSLWIGGAVWHNFVVLPTIRTRPGTASPVKSQAQKFRRHLPIIIVLLAVSGAYQTDRLIGLSAPALLQSLLGHLIILKLLILVVLTGLVIASYKRAN